MKVWKVSAALALAMIASGCAGVGSFVQSEVQQFHQVDTQRINGAKIAVLPWREGESSLEFVTYANALAQRLGPYGMRPVTSGERPDIVIFLDYGIDDGRDVTYSYSVPRFGQTGVASATTNANASVVGNTANVTATTTYTPSYGITGYDQRIGQRTEYRRFVNVDFVDLRDDPAGKVVYEGRLKSSGTCGTMASIMPSLLEALIEGFPNESGRGRTVRTAWTGQC